MRPVYGTTRFMGPPGFRQMPPVTRATLVLSVVGYLLFVFSGMTKHLVLVPAAVFPGLQVWRLLSYPLVIAGILNLVFALLLLWSFGSELEREWGSRGYGIFLALSTLTAGLMGILVALLMRGSFTGAGVSPLLTGLIFAWMLLGPHRPSNLFGVLPMTRRVFALIAIIFVAFSELEQTHSIVLSLPSLAFLFGALPAAWFWARGRRPGGPHWLRVPRFLRRRRFRVVRGDDSGRFH